MDLRKLKTLIDLVSESNISELEITEADGKVRIVKAEPPAAAPALMQGASPLPSSPALAVPAALSTPPSEALEIVETGHVVKSPMVGTFYRSPAPEAKSAPIDPSPSAPRCGSRSFPPIPGSRRSLARRTMGLARSGS